jgi:branched-chain amino acid transport system permease protein
MLQLIVFNITNGLIIGAFYALMAIGLSLILNLSGVINFAHGGFLVIGGYLAYTLTPSLGFWGALIVAPFLTALIGFVIERLLIRRLYGRDPLYSLLLTFGLAFIIEDGTRQIWGAQGLPVSIPAALSSPLSNEFFFITGYRMFMVATVAIVVGLLFVLLRYTRIGVRIRAGTLDLDTVAALGVNVRALRSLNFAVGIFLAGLAGVLAGGPRAGADHGRRPIDAELHRHHRRRRRLAHRHAARRAADRSCLRCHGGDLSVRERGGHLRDDGGRASAAAARAARRRRYVHVTAARGRHLAILAAIWGALIFAPYWMPLFGGYTALGSRVLVLGLGAMSVNFLLGFTGVLSFGHAAWFGLGAYACGLALKFVAPSTPLALVAGTLVGGIAGAILGGLLIRRRGIYFAMVTIAFGQVFYYIAFQWSSLTGGDDGLRGFARQPLDFELLQIDLLHNDVSFYYFVLVCFAAVVTIMAFILRSPFGRTMIAIRENERRARFLGIPIELHIWIAFTLSCFFMAFAGALYALINNFADPRMLHYTLSGDFVIMAVMGGMRAFWGPLLGAVIFVVLQDYISSVTVNWMSFIGILIVFIVLFFPRGVLGLLRQRRAA